MDGKMQNADCLSVHLLEIAQGIDRFDRNRALLYDCE